MIERLRLREFTAFKELDMCFSPGVNLLIGENATGKTHILKALYAPMRALSIGGAYAHSLESVFLPHDDNLLRLVHKPRGGSPAELVVTRNGKELRITFGEDESSTGLGYVNAWPKDADLHPVYVPVKEMLANAPGFRSMYTKREVHFESVYADILDAAYLPPLKDQNGAPVREALQKIERVLGGNVSQRDEVFYLTESSQQDPIEFTLVAEGLRKFALLWLLVRNGTICPEATLFWDEPESNLNPSLVEKLVELLLGLTRDIGVQIFLATHSYVVLKHFDLQRKTGDNLRYFSLKRDADKQSLTYASGDSYSDIVPNTISDAYSALYDLEVDRSLGIHAK